MNPYQSGWGLWGAAIGQQGATEPPMQQRGSSSPRCLCHCVFDSFHWSSPDNLPGWLGLEYCWLLCERIDSFPRFGGGLFDDNKFREARHKEGSRFLEFFVAYVGE